MATLHNTTQHRKLIHSLPVIPTQPTDHARRALSLIQSSASARGHASTPSAPDLHLFTPHQNKKKNTHIQLVSVESQLKKKRRKKVSRIHLHHLMLQRYGINNKERNCAEDKIVPSNQHHPRHTQIKATAEDKQRNINICQFCCLLFPLLLFFYLVAGGAILWL